MIFHVRTFEISINEWNLTISIDCSFFLINFQENAGKKTNSVNDWKNWFIHLSCCFCLFLFSLINSWSKIEFCVCFLFVCFVLKIFRWKGSKRFYKMFKRFNANIHRDLMADCDWIHCCCYLGRRCFLVQNYYWASVDMAGIDCFDCFVVVGNFADFGVDTIDCHDFRSFDNCWNYSDCSHHLVCCFVDNYYCCFRDSISVNYVHLHLYR